MKKINAIRRCRLCACEESLKGFTNIYDDDVGLDLELKITKLLPIVVMPWDPMPHIICHECIGKLESFNEFYEATTKAEQFLRSLYPSVPDNELENLDPVVHMMDSPLIEEGALKLPPKKRQGVIHTVGKSAEDKSAASPEFIEIIESPKETAGSKKVEEISKTVLSCFIVNHITNHESVFTCRNCYRTFTKQSSALTHPCIRLEDCEELETLTESNEDEEKSLPPLKIRLFTVKSGLFVCYLCRAPFQEKTELVKHLKGHLVDGKFGSGLEKKCGRPKGRRRKQSQDGEKEPAVEVPKKKPTARRKRKKSTGPPRKRTRSKAQEPCQEDACVKCGKVQKSPNSKKTVERMTQYSEASCESVPEIIEEEIREEPVKDTPAEKTEQVTDREENCPEELIEILDGDPKSDEVTVLEVLNSRTETNFSSCAFCDKVFATKEALIGHQNRHLLSNPSLKSEDNLLCCVCAMMFPCSKTLQEHEQLHQSELEPGGGGVVGGVGGGGVGSQRKIRIALNPEFPEPIQELKSRGIITITVTSTEKKIPQIEFI